MQRPIVNFLTSIFLIGFLFSSCAPSIAPTLTEETPCVGVACLPPTLTPASTVPPILTPTATIGVDREIAKAASITFWHSYPLTNIELIKSLIGDFNRNNSDGIIVEDRGFYSDDQLLDAISSSSKLPDVIMAENGLLQIMEAEIGLTDLLPYISDPLIGMSGEQMQSISHESWINLLTAGKQIGIPSQKNVYFLLYNTSWAKLLGYQSPPETFEDFTDQSRAGFEANITHQNISFRGTGGWLIDFKPETALAWMGTDFDGNREEDIFSQPTVQAAFDELKSMQNAGYSWIGIKSDPVPYFVNRNAIFISASSHELPEMIIHMKALKMADDWSIIPYPHLNNTSKNIARGYSYGLLTKEQDKQMAGWLFIRWMLDADHQAYIGANQYTIPEDTAALDRLQDFSSEGEVLDALIQTSLNSGDTPSYPAWVYGKSILADGFKQLFQPETTIDSIPSIIDELNRTFTEIQEMEITKP